MSMKKGDKAPEFQLTDTNGDKVTLKEIQAQGKGDTILLFFPLAFSGVCTKEMCTVRDNMKLYNAFKSTITAISVDSFFTLKEFKKANNINFTLLSDFNREASKKYGVLYEDYFGMKGVSKRSAFIISPEGILKYAEVLEDSGQQPDFKAIQNILSGN